MRGLRGKLVGLVLAMGLVPALAAVARADDYQADPVHSFVVFRVHHFGAGYVYGTFVGPTGTVTLNDADATKDAFDLTVQADSLDTRNKNRDKDLKGPDFFDVKQFPTLTFKSTAVKKTGDTTLEVTGDLTMHGVTKSITVEMDLTGSGKGMKGETRTGLETTFTVDRTDYGVSYDPPPAIANDVRITVAVEAIKQ
jgi:polyisoprenoid-binding protein YceI